MSDIFEVSDDAVERLADDDPTSATYAGISGRDHRWPDYSPDGAANTRRLHEELRSAATECATPDDRHVLAQRVLIDHCDAMIRLHDSGHHEIDLNNIASPHQSLRFIYGSMAADTAEDWEAIVSRLSSTAVALEGYRESLEAGRARGNVVSRRQVEAVLEQGEGAVGADSSYHSLERRLDASGVADDDRRARLTEAIGEAKAAFASFNDYLRDTYLPDANPVDAVGEERYVRAAEMFLGTELDPHETYRWGWDEVERLWGEMEAACAAIDPDAPAADVLAALATERAYAAADIEDFVAQMTERQHHALAALEGTHFDVPEPIRTIDVQVEPAGGALAAHYVGPSEDFARAGSVWYPVEGKEHFPLFTEVTTAYHEGFPGHHLQVGVQQTMGDALSRFHRTLVWYPGSGEGWALYAEHLMGELGFLEKPEYVVGLLTSQLLRSCRIAIDIGAHLDLAIPDDVSFHPGERWSFELAHELLTTRGFLDDDLATSETLRYFGWPGQAISYKVGERAILDLRDEWKAAAGDAYDPKAFHSAVLAVGSVGLDLLVDRVRAAMPT